MDGKFVEINGKIYKKPQLGVVKRKVTTSFGRTILVNEENDVFLRTRSGKTYYVSTILPNQILDDNNLQKWLAQPIR